MAPLKSLEKDYPMIDSNFQHFCASQGILSVEDLLIHDLDDLVALARQNSASGRLKQGITQVLSIINGLHQPWLNGMELLKDVQQNKHILSTGCERIDLFLQGGLREGYLTELVGPSSSGKTQVCLKAASNVAKAHRGGVVFLDTGNSFSPKRMAKFTISDMVNKEANQKILQEVLKSIVCHSVFDIFTLLDVLNQLKSSLMSQIGGQVQLLIVDSISSLITPVLGGSSSHGHALMISAGYLLKKMANEHNLAVLVTNHMVGGEGGISKPALGESWKSIPHVRLQLSREQGSNTFNMRLLRHPYMGSTCVNFGRVYYLPQKLQFC
ncbi:DNA repair protein RAD51 homolog 4 isoform X2 [Diospyros lotus]|uniref:DNA repair protein RAD51 homolog 4 isoform X2 n=1 Tax=Diospyros lotus TaxID=55363 RepID=UPI0022540291|nr:DNA repair protein RAD51 homolog 4 isoform X2 [Diospyros lotus]